MFMIAQIKIPKLLENQDHSAVTPMSWYERASRIKTWYEEWMYGAIPDAAEEEIDAKVGVVECVEREAYLLLPTLGVFHLFLCTYCNN
jgi:hypothetical protein